MATRSEIEQRTARLVSENEIDEEDSFEDMEEDEEELKSIEFCIEDCKNIMYYSLKNFY